MAGGNSTTKIVPKVQEKVSELGQGPPDTVHARVSVAVAFKRLEALDAIAAQPAKVRKWSQQFWLELQSCRVVA
jgi:hypothetical protein